MDAHDKAHAEFGNRYCADCADEGLVTYADDRYSCGAYAGRYCDRHWDAAGYREDRPSIDPADCGESE